MSKYFCLSILLMAIVLAVGCSSSETSPEAPQKSFLWEVRSDISTVYILGSIHVASPELYPLADSIENAFDQSESLAVEFDITAMNESQMARLLMQKARYPEGENLYRNISRDLYEKADEVLEDLGADILLFNSFEPWAVAMEIEAMQLVRYGYTPENGIDMYYLQRAHEENRKIYELESARFQINLFDEFPEDVQIFMLEDIVDDPPTEKELNQMFASWENGDVAEMERLMFEDDDESPEIAFLNEKLLDERNFQMAEKIEEFLEEEETCFVVVGAGHLVGENGIINLLQEEGYAASQL